MPIAQVCHSSIPLISFSLSRFPLREGLISNRCSPFRRKRPPTRPSRSQCSEPQFAAIHAHPFSACDCPPCDTLRPQPCPSLYALPCSYFLLPACAFAQFLKTSSRVCTSNLSPRLHA